MPKLRPKRIKRVKNPPSKLDQSGRTLIDDNSDENEQKMSSAMKPMIKFCQNCQSKRNCQHWINRHQTSRAAICKKTRTRGTDNTRQFASSKITSQAMLWRQVKSNTQQCRLVEPPEFAWKERKYLPNRRKRQKSHVWWKSWHPKINLETENKNCEKRFQLHCLNCLIQYWNGCFQFCCLI